MHAWQRSKLQDPEYLIHYLTVVELGTVQTNVGQIPYTHLLPCLWGQGKY